MALLNVSIDSIIVKKRFREDYGDIDGLAADIKKQGQIQPLAVKDLENGTYELIAGDRRLTAMRQAELVCVDVKTFPIELSDLEFRSIELMENVCRKDMTWQEVTNLRKEIHDIQIQLHGTKVSTSPDAEGHSQADTAKLLNISKGALTADLKMAKALEVFPELKKAKNRSEADKLLKKMQEDIVVGEMAKRVRAKEANTPIEQIHHKLINNYVVADFFDAIKKIPDRSIDLVEIDPPYGIDLKAIKKSDNAINAGTINYNEVPANEYIPFLENLFKECNRVMSENSWLICWFAQEPWFEVVFQALMRRGFTGSRVTASWYKQGSPGQTMHPESLLANNREDFFYVRKGYPSITTQGHSNVFPYKTVPASRKIHPTERPIELIQDVLQTFTWEGCRVMVPFAGSGNTLLAASNLGLTAFGFDLSEEYKNGYTLRVVEGKPGSYRSFKENGND